MALAAMLVTAGFTSCSSDDDNNTPAPEPEEVTKVEVTGQFAYPNSYSTSSSSSKGIDLSAIYDFYAKSDYNIDGYITRKGHMATFGNFTSKVFSLKDSKDKNILIRCWSARLDRTEFTSFPATYSFTIYVKMWEDLNNFEETDVYDYFVAPYFTVKTNLDEEAKTVRPGNPGYTYYPMVNYLEIKNNPALLEKYEGKYICTLNIDKDGNCTATQKFEKLTAADKEMLDAATSKSDK